ncbi:MAG TPA: sigma 54-interacting transcriptional regulator, partial [bacterium]|nr:sigma 54-interacting transcriptional regulator [bacterium]
PELISRSALAIARLRSDLDQTGIRTYCDLVRETAPRWGGWSVLKVAEILEALDDFRSGFLGKGIRELHRHVKEADESEFTAPRLRSRLALAEALIELGDYTTALDLLNTVGILFTSLQHSGLRYLQSTAELLWFQAFTRQSSVPERLIEALDRLEILLAVVAKYPRPPGPAPFWLTIGILQNQLNQGESALRSLRKASTDAEVSFSPRISAAARYMASTIEWQQLTESGKQHGSERNRILAETTRALEGISKSQRPELEWRIHYLRGKIFAESGEQYPAREEMKTAAGIAARIIVSMEDPTLQTVYRKTEERNEALIELQEFMEIAPVGAAPAVAFPSETDGRGEEQVRENNRLENLLDALYRIHESRDLKSMLSVLAAECLQLIEGDQCKVQLLKNGSSGDAVGAVRSTDDSAESIDIPGRWIREVCAGKGVFSYIRNADETHPDSRRILLSAIRKNDTVFGVIYLDRLRTREAFSVAEESILKTLSSVAAIACSSLLIRDRMKELTDQFRREIVPEFKHIIGESQVMKDIFIQMQRVASAEIPVLIVGDTGTGKDLVARTIHEISPRVDHPFVYLDCSAIPMTLLESELFGIAEGIATGVESRVGLLEYANGGTILMDEVGDVPLNTQAKLLRVLQEREFEPVGSDQTVNINIRVIATTSRNLDQLIREGRMREDFYYRLTGSHLAPVLDT